MEERRKVQRGRTLKAGSIVFNSAAGIDWRVRNMSAAGACLEVTSQVGVPNDFVLVVGYDKIQADVPRRLAFGHAPGCGISRCLVCRRRHIGPWKSRRGRTRWLGPQRIDRQSIT